MLKAYFFCSYWQTSVPVFIFFPVYFCSLLFLTSTPLPPFRKAHKFSRKLVQNPWRYWCGWWQGWTPITHSHWTSAGTKNSSNLGLRSMNRNGVYKKREGTWGSKFLGVVVLSHSNNPQILSSRLSRDFPEHADFRSLVIDSYHDFNSVPYPVSR